MDDADAVGGTEMAGVAGGRSRVRGQAGQEVRMPDRRSQSDRVTSEALLRTVHVEPSY